MFRLKYVNIFFQLIFFSKKELQHFEHRLQKHDHYQDQLRVSEEAVRINYKDGEKPEKHTQLEQTVRDYGRKVQSKSYQNLYINFFEDIVLLVITMCSMLQFAVLKRWGQMWLLYHKWKLCCNQVYEFTCLQVEKYHNDLKYRISKAVQQHTELWLL